MIDDDPILIAHQIYHERAVEHNAHVYHGIKHYIVQRSPTVIVMVACPCGRAFAMTNGRLSAGDADLFEVMEGKDAS